MTFGGRLSKLLTNKYVLYFVVFLAITNILGYLITNKIRPVIYFALISLLTSYFSRNMIVILLVGLFVTNLLVSNNIIEGLSNNDDMMLSEEDDIMLAEDDIILAQDDMMLAEEDNEDRLMDIDEELKRGIDALRETNGDVTKAKEIISE
jgi:hypothetical protein